MARRDWLACALLATSVACGSTDHAGFFSDSEMGAGASAGRHAQGGDTGAGGFGGESTSTGGAVGGTGGSATGGLPGATGGVGAAGGTATGGAITDTGGTDSGGTGAGAAAGAGGAGTGGSSGSGAGTGGAGGAGGTGSAGAPPIDLPTGTQGFPTNAPACPAELPPDGTSCGFGLGCQYPGTLCTCGFSSQLGCNPQESQCLDQAHCALGLCHPELHVCTECVDDTHCFDAARPRCRADGVCVECLTGTDCGGSTPACNFIPFSPAVSTCVECAEDLDCSNDETCDTFFGSCQSN